MRLTNVTVTGNTASNSGGGIYNPGIGTISFGNTIIAGNTAPSGPDGSGFNFNSQDYNLIGNTSQLNQTGITNHNITNVNALLSPLGNFGGPTQTHALLAGSPAIDAADNCVLTNTCSPVLEAAITTDQRGAGFPARGRCERRRYRDSRYWSLRSRCNRGYQHAGRGRG